MTAGPFSALGLPARPDLTDDDIRAAWRRIAAATHPDRADGGDPARFAAAAAAYTELRTRYGRGEAYADLTTRNSSVPRNRPRPATARPATRREDTGRRETAAHRETAGPGKPRKPPATGEPSPGWPPGFAAAGQPCSHSGSRSRPASPRPPSPSPAPSPPPAGWQPARSPGSCSPPGTTSPHQAARPPPRTPAAGLQLDNLTRRRTPRLPSFAAARHAYSRLQPWQPPPPAAPTTQTILTGRARSRVCQLNGVT